MNGIKRAPLAGALGAAILMVSAVHAAVYVVDCNHPQASDRNGGSEARPWKTITHATSRAKPGDTVCVMAGKYDERVKLKTSGTKGKPIVFRGLPLRSVEMGGFDLGTTSHVTVQGFTITWKHKHPGLVVRGTQVAILDNTINEMGYGVQGSYGTPNAEKTKRDYSACHHVTVAYNKMYKCGYGILIGGEDWLVESNDISRQIHYGTGDSDYTRAFGKNITLRYNYFHDTDTRETKQSHVDGSQVFTAHGLGAKHVLLEHNVIFDWGQGCMVSGSGNIGNVSDWTWRHNIFSSNTEKYRGAWGLCVVNTPNAVIENNTFATILYYGVGLVGTHSTNGRIVNNLCYDIGDTGIIDKHGSHKVPCNPVIEKNLSFKTKSSKSDKDIHGKDPLLADPARRNFRLTAGSPAIDAGLGGEDIGALAYPNVYYVDPRHPGASDEGHGYPGAPFKTASHACSVAKTGETVVLRGGVYRETLRPQADGVMIRAAKGEKVLVSGADLVTGWKRGDDGWAAPMARQPGRVLLDGKPWSEFAYDAGSKTIRATGFDPRLHVVECVVREHGVDLRGREDVKIEGLDVIHTTGDAIAK